MGSVYQDQEGQWFVWCSPLFRGNSRQTCHRHEPTEAHQVSLRKRCHPLGLLWSITLAIYGAHGLLMRLQHALCQARDRRFQMSPAAQDKLSA